MNCLEKSKVLVNKRYGLFSEDLQPQGGEQKYGISCILRPQNSVTY